MSTSEKIDRVVTNRILGLPIFVVIMFCVYYIAVSTLGGTVTDFTNDQLFGTDGWYVLGQGRDAYDAAVEAAGDAADSIDPAEFGPYVPGITTVVHDALVAGGTEDGAGRFAGLRRHRRRPGRHLRLCAADVPALCDAVFLGGLRLHGPRRLYHGRVFRRFGLSGKSFIPMLVSSGCGVPGVMATKTIENEKDRRMTVMTTTFIPCGAKLPIIALLMGSIIGDSSTTAAWISRSSTSWASLLSSPRASCSRRPSSSPVARRRSLWSFPPTTSRRSALGRCTCGSAAGPLSRRPARSSSRPPSSFGSSPTLVATTVPLASCPRWTASPRSSWTTLCLPCSATWSLGSSPRSALAPGRQLR